MTHLDRPSTPRIGINTFRGALIRVCHTGRRAIGAVVVGLAAQSCSPTVLGGEPFNQVIVPDVSISDASVPNDLTDASDAAETAPSDVSSDGPMDGGIDDASDATAEMPFPLDMAVMETGPTDIPDVNAPEVSVDSGSDLGTADAVIDSNTGDTTPPDVANDTPSDEAMDAGVMADTAETPDAREDAMDSNTPDTAAVDSGNDVISDVIDASNQDIIDVVDATESGVDASRDASVEAGADVPVDSPTDAGPVTRITYTDSGTATCTRIIIVGIPGCTPGMTECSYSRSTGGRIQYVIDAVSLPRSASRVEYTFFQILSGSPRQVFTTPYTPEITPSISNGIYEVSVGLIINGVAPSSASICRGPYIRVVN